MYRSLYRDQTTNWSHQLVKLIKRSWFQTQTIVSRGELFVKQFIVPPSKLRSKSRTASRTSTSYLVARRSFAAHLDVLFVEDVFPGFGLFVAPSHNPSSPNVALASPCRRSRGAPRFCRYHGNSSAWNASPISIEDTREETLDVRRILSLIHI